MHLEKVAGLPAHPLFVHLPIVLIPLVAIGAIAMAFSPRVRDRLGWTILGLAIVAGLSTQLAIESGQALRHHVADSADLRHHVQIAESIRPLILLLFVVALGVMLLDRRSRGAWPFAGEPGAAPSALRTGALAVIVVLVAAGTCVRLYQIGDSGARATWAKTQLTSAPGHR